jgi:hypothetical protein
MRAIAMVCLLVAGAFAQTQEPKDGAPVVSESAALKATRHSFMLVSTKSVALFRAADTIEARLQADGSTLRPSTTALRLRLEHTLDQAEAAINKGDLTKADEHIKVADELATRFARRIGDE